MKQITFASIVLLAVLFAACSKDNDTPSNSPKQEKQEQSVSIEAGSLRFNFTEEGFGEDVETTRAAELPKEEVVDIGNGLEARISVERDPVPAATRAPKPIADGNYTIVAFKGTQRLDQKITFTVTGGVTTITSPKGRYSWVANETYTFVCYNDKVTESGDQLFCGYSPTETIDALIGRQTITINNADQELTFQMKHAGFRVRTKLCTLIEAPTVTSAEFVSGLTIRSIGFKTFSGEESFNYPQFGPAIPQTFTGSGSYVDNDLEDDLYTVTATQYGYYLAGKGQTIHFSCQSGTLYGKPLQVSHSLDIGTLNGFKANGSYTVKIKLMPRYLYLFEDGQTGYLSSPNRQNHVPIAVVFDPTGRRAVSLWDANNGNGAQWDTDPNYEVQRNSVMFANTTPHPGLTNPMSGYLWTWESYDSFHNGSHIVKGNTPQFAAFYAAAKYYTDARLLTKAAGKGGSLTTALQSDTKWYLPSWREWREVFEKLGLGGSVTTWGTYPWKGSLVNYAFKVAKGTSIATGNATNYWSASENDIRFAFLVATDRSNMSFNSYFKNAAFVVRPFVNY